MRTGSASEFLILWSYVIISLGLILSPFFILWWKRLTKWRWIFLAYFLSIVIFLGIFFATNWYDRYLYYNVYNSGWLMEVLLDAGRNQFLFFAFILILSPYCISKLKYIKINLKRGLISTVFSIVIFGIIFGIFLYYTAWTLGQVGMLYF
jgi:hypothetical protein